MEKISAIEIVSCDTITDHGVVCRDCGEVIAVGRMARKVKEVCKPVVWYHLPLCPRDMVIVREVIQRADSRPNVLTKKKLATALVQCLL